MQVEPCALCGSETMLRSCSVECCALGGVILRGDRCALCSKTGVCSSTDFIDQRFDVRTS